MGKEKEKRELLFSSDGTQVSLNSVSANYTDNNYEYYIIGTSDSANPGALTYTWDPDHKWIVNPSGTGINDPSGSGINIPWPGVTTPTITFPNVEVTLDQESNKSAKVEIRPAPTVADLLVEIALLKSLEVNQIFDKYGVKIVDKDGLVIYDAEEREKEITNKPL